VTDKSFPSEMMELLEDAGSGRRFSNLRALDFTGREDQVFGCGARSNAFAEYGLDKSTEGTLSSDEVNSFNVADDEKTVCLCLNG
jgi:hypothetical protein